MRIAVVHDSEYVHLAATGDDVVRIDLSNEPAGGAALLGRGEPGLPEGCAGQVRLLPERPEHRYFTSLQRDSDRLLDTILAVHRQEPLDVVLLRVDPAFALGLIRAQRLLGELPGVELRFATTEHSRFTGSGSEPDDVIARFMRAQVLRHRDPDGSVRIRRRPPVPASRRQGGGPTVSVIIPVHNVTGYLGEAVASVRTGHGIPIELIVVDDGSDPVAAQVISATPGVQVVRQQRGGLAAARNTGLRHATGEYVLPLDADDLLEPWFIPEALAALQSNDDLAYVCSYVRYFGAIGSCLPPLGYVPDLSIVVNTFARATALFRRDALTACGGYDETMRSGEDWDLYLRLQAAGRHGDVLPLEGVRYRRHAESMTFTMDDDQRRRTLTRIVRTHGRALPADRLSELLTVMADLWTTGYQPSASREYLSREPVSAMTQL